MLCERKCDKNCVAKCRGGHGRKSKAPDSRAARTKTRQRMRDDEEKEKMRLALAKGKKGKEGKDGKEGKEGKEGKHSVEQQQPKRKWEWERKMEDAQANGKQVGHDIPATVRGKPMDEACKKECMPKCQRRCTKKSPSPDKCPKQCLEQCEDDCYIVEGGAPPDADVFMPGNGEEVRLHGRSSLALSLSY